MIENRDVQFWCEDNEQLMIPDHWASPVPGERNIVEYVVRPYAATDDEQPIIVSAR